jgi:hypothetical protein
MNHSLPRAGVLEGELIAQRERARFAARLLLQKQHWGVDWTYLVYVVLGWGLGWLVSRQGTVPIWVGGTAATAVFLAGAAYRECRILRRRQDAIIALLSESSAS